MSKPIHSSHPIRGTAIVLGTVCLLLTAGAVRLNAGGSGEAVAADRHPAKKCAVAEAGRANCPVVAVAAETACAAKMKCSRVRAKACGAETGVKAKTGACGAEAAGEDKAAACPTEVVDKADNGACAAAKAGDEAKAGDDAKAGACGAKTPDGGTAPGSDEEQRQSVSNILTRACPQPKFVGM